MLIGMRNAMLAGEGSQPSGYWGLCFTAEEAGATVAMNKVGTPPEVNLLYSTDAANWSPFVVGTTTVTLASVGDKVWIKAGSGGNTQLATSSGSNRFSLSGLVAASGSIMSLINGEEETLTIPAIHCFNSLFYRCTSLTTPPSLPATTLMTSCYYSLFYGCSSLTIAPELPAGTLFATSYFQMFAKCTSLTSAELSATTLATLSLTQMFDGCSALASIRASFTAFNTLATGNWVRDVAASGIFYCPTALGTNETIGRGTGKCPEGWTVINTDAA